MSIGKVMKNRMIGYGMEAYFDAYKKKWPDKDIESAIRAMRNWITGYIKGVSGSQLIDQDTNEKIKRKLNELRLKDP